MALLSVFQILPTATPGRKISASARRLPTAAAQKFEPLIGLFINTLVLRSDLPAAGRTLVQRVRETSLAHTRTRICRSRSWSMLQPERSTNRSPLFQVMFLMQNAPVSSEAFQGLEAEWLTDPGTAMFDLTLR